MPMTSHAEMMALMAEAEANAEAHSGAWFTLTFPDGTTARFELWPRRFTFAQRREVRRVIGRPLDQALADLATGNVGADTVVGLVWAALFQAEGAKADTEQLVHLVDRAVDLDGGRLDPPAELDPADEDGDPADPES